MLILHAKISERGSERGSERASKLRERRERGERGFSELGAVQFPESNFSHSLLIAFSDLLPFSKYKL